MPEVGEAGKGGKRVMHDFEVRPRYEDFIVHSRNDAFSADFLRIQRPLQDVTKLKMIIAEQNGTQNRNDARGALKKVELNSRLSVSGEAVHSWSSAARRQDQRG